MRLESGPATLDRLYYLGFFLLCVGLGAYFLYDHKIGYLNKNRQVARKQLAPLIGTDKIPDQFGETPTRPIFEALVKAAPTDPAAVRARLGEPLFTKQIGPGQSVEYYVSDYGMAEVTITAGQVDPASMRWHEWYKSREAIQQQLYFGLLCFVVAALVFYRFYKAATLRAVIDDEGMTYGGLRIGFADMLRLVDYNRKGWVDLYYRGADGRERRLRIDNQKIRKFDEIIEALCEAKGLSLIHI